MKGNGPFFLFQVKIKDVTATVCKRELHSQIMSLIYRPLKYRNYKFTQISRRIILITNDSINEYVETEIRNINEKSYIPIEYYDLKHFSYFIASKIGSLDELNYLTRNEPFISIDGIEEL